MNTSLTEINRREPDSKGKVRDIYNLGEKLALVASDRHSSFDRVIAEVPGKGKILNLMSKFWFENTKDIIQNHAIEYPDERTVIAKKCKVIPIEVIVRGYITGVTSTSLWTNYKNGQRDFGDFKLEEGIKKNQKLPEPVVTPTTKSNTGDESISFQEIISRNIIEEILANKIRETALKLFKPGQEISESKGWILVDTKYEFGLDENNQLTLIDEIHTPDSSRFWKLSSYQERFNKGEEPEAFDKEFLRLWFKENCDPYNDEVLPEAPEELINKLVEKYQEIYESICF